MMHRHWPKRVNDHKMAQRSEFKEGPNQLEFPTDRLRKDNPFIDKHPSSDGHAIFIYKFAYTFNSYKDFQMSLDIQAEQNLAHVDFTSQM